MQGRLSPIADGKIQAFPRETWRDEFPLALSCGYTFIEWVLDRDTLDHNPVMTREGRRAILDHSRETGLAVPVLCADVFMENSFHTGDLRARLEALGTLCELIRSCREAGIRQIEIPLIGPAGLTEHDAEAYVTDLLNDCVPLAEKHDVELLLEVDLDPTRIVDLMARLPMRQVFMNYDTGNSAFWGFSVDDEIPVYGDRIGNVHIKDCTPEAYSVPLGEGNVDFDRTFLLLKEIGYRGDFVLQAARGEDHAKIAKSFCDFTRSHIDRYLNGS